MKAITTTRDPGTSSSSTFCMRGRACAVFSLYFTATSVPSEGAKEPRSQGAKEPRSQEAKEPRSQGAKEPRSSGVAGQDYCLIGAIPDFLMAATAAGDVMNLIHDLAA